MARSTGTRQIEGHALNTRAEDRVHEGEVEEALEDMAEAMRIARETANLDDIGRAYANVIDVLEVSGRLEEAVAAAFEGLEDTRRLGLLTFFGTHLLCNAGSLLYRLGRWDDADAAIVRADEIGASGVNEILVREMRARLALARGQFEVAAEELRTARPMAERAADGQVIGPVHASLAELALWQHRPAEAAEVIETGIVGLAHSSDIRYAEVWTLGIRAYADLADIARARRSTSDAEAAIAAGNTIRDGLRRRHGERVPAAIAGQAELWTLLADAEARRLEGVPDPDAWAAAAQAWADAGRPYPAAYARHFRPVRERGGAQGGEIVHGARDFAIDRRRHELFFERAIAQEVDVAARLRLAVARFAKLLDDGQQLGARAQHLILRDLAVAEQAFAHAQVFFEQRDARLHDVDGLRRLEPVEIRDRHIALEPAREGDAAELRCFERRASVRESKQVSPARRSAAAT